ncbi:MAG TPA: class I SAM-dependent methyltransferase [Gemmatimonadaceae bacterium]|nr:class I SAM-dependent methyltransferase [Gemmatimonadaceae bacterium]
MNPVEWLHERYVKGRRERALAASIAAVLPEHASVLDVGCGDGSLAVALLQTRPDLTIRGLEVSERAGSRIPVTLFDGAHLPHADRAFDVVLFADVLHHTPHAEALLQEARRVARQAIVIKDHTADGFLAWPTLRFMDRVGNARFGVALPHLYLGWAEWQLLFARLGVAVKSLERRLGLYPWPLSLLFERSLHFVARLEGEGEPQ